MYGCATKYKVRNRKVAFSSHQIENGDKHQGGKGLLCLSGPAKSDFCGRGYEIKYYL